MAFISTSCSSDDEDEVMEELEDEIEEPEEGNSELTAEVNGQLFSSNFLLEGGVRELTNGGYEINISGLMLSGEDTTFLSLHMYGIQFTNLKAGDTFSISEVSNGVPYGLFIDYGAEPELSASSFSKGSFSSTIVDIDHEKRRVSGTFAYTAQTESGEIFEITNGVFKDIAYGSGISAEEQKNFGELNATYNGRNFTIKGGLIESHKLPAGNNNYDFTIRALRYYYGQDSLELAIIDIVLTGSDFDMLSVGDQFIGSDGSAFFSYVSVTELYQSDATASTVCTITDIDSEEGLLSGSFSFETNGVPVMRGTFSNL